MYISARIRDSNNVSGIRQRGETTGNTVLCSGVLEIKDLALEVVRK